MMENLRNRKGYIEMVLTNLQLILLDNLIYLGGLVDYCVDRANHTVKEVIEYTI